MQQWSRKAALVAAWAVTIGTIGTGGLSYMSNPSAARAATPNTARLPAFQAEASASVLRLATLVDDDRSAELGGLRLGTAASVVDSGSPPEALSSATQLTGVADAPNVSAAVRSAGTGARPSGATSHSGPGFELPQLTLGGSRLNATARWGPGEANASRPGGLTSALARPGELLVHPDDDDAPLLQVWRGSQGHSQTQLVAVPGQQTLGVRATARAELTDVTLFRGTPAELTIRFTSAPSLVALAAGTERTGVRYTPPTVEITAAQGRSYRLDAVGETVEIPLAGPGGCGAGCGPEPEISGTVRISLGAPRERIGHTSVDATAGAVRLQVRNVPGVGDRLDTTLGDLGVSARVPLGGLAAGPVTTPARPLAGSAVRLDESAAAAPSPSGDVASPPAADSPPPAQDSPRPAPETPEAGPTLPVTGARLSLLAGLGLALLALGWVVFRLGRRPKRR